MKGPEAIENLLREGRPLYAVEQVAIRLDTRRRLIRKAHLTNGPQDAAIEFPRDVFRHAAVS